jgi:hypothetical protein
MPIILWNKSYCFESRLEWVTSKALPKNSEALSVFVGNDKMKLIPRDF